MSHNHYKHRVGEDTSFSECCETTSCIRENSDQPPTTMSADNKSTKIGCPFYLPLISSISMILLFFSDWFYISDHHTYSLFDILVNRQIYHQIIPHITIILMGITIIFFVGILLTVLFYILMLRHTSAAMPVGISACIVPLLIPLFLCITTGNIHTDFGWNSLFLTGQFYFAFIMTVLSKRSYSYIGQ